MSVIHFLNVLHGDCSIIQHNSSHCTVIDVNNAKSVKLQKSLTTESTKIAQAESVKGNFKQKHDPVNPIEYLQSLKVSSIFRFILTHPDMDHMGGIKDLFEEFAPLNFWDTDNKEKKDFKYGSPYNADDWTFYKNLRDSSPSSDPKRLTLYHDAKGKYFNRDAEGNSGGDGLNILAPTQKLLNFAIEAEDYNDSSYVILFKTKDHKILFSGDTNDKTWEHLLANCKSDISEVDILVAPHHGRRSERNFDFLDIVKPKITFFGNADSDHLAYEAWNRKGYKIMTNNQANCIIVNANVSPMELYVTNEPFARAYNPYTFFDANFNGYYCCDIN